MCIRDRLRTYKPNFGKSKINNLIRLSANESALGASMGAIKALKFFANDLNRYPPQVSDELTSAISKRYLLNKKKIILGNGSDELISILAQTFLNSSDEAIYTEFGFLQFPQAIAISGAKGVVANDVNFTANVDNILSKINSKIYFWTILHRRLAKSRGPISNPPPLGLHRRTAPTYPSSLEYWRGRDADRLILGAHIQESRKH